MGSPEHEIAPLEVDRASLLELARGANLYSGPFACLRELVQNAVDATLLRVFVEHGMPPTNEESMRALRRALAAYPIDVEIARIEDEGDVRRYRVRVIDRGMGIASADVPHLQRIGSSSKNPARAALIDAMPEWMRPSGTFGIGLQSAFLVSDTLTLRSRAMTGEAIELVLRSADGGTIERGEGDRSEIGTTVELVVRVGREVSPAGSMVWRFDSLLERDHDVLLAEAIERAETIARRSLASIRVDGRVPPRPAREDAAFFDPETLLELWLPEDDEGTEDAFVAKRAFHRDRPSRCGYRGLAIHAEGVLPTQHDAHLEIHGSSARRLLTLSREVLSPEGRAWLTPRIAKTYVRHGRARLAEIGDRDEARSLRCWLSLHLFRLDDQDDGAWRAIVVGDQSDAPPVTLGDVVHAGSVTLTTKRPIRAFLSSGQELSGERSYPFFFVMAGISRDATDRYTLTAAAAVHVSMRYLGEHLRSREVDPFRRPYLPCPDAYASLRIAACPVAPDILRPPDVGRGGAMLSPWTFRDGAVDLPSVRRWVAWTANEYGGPPRNPSEVARALAGLLRDFDPDLRANPNLRVVYDLDAVLTELAALYA